MINKNKPRSKNARILLGSIAVLGLTGLGASSASAVSYTISPSGTGTPLDWNTSANWSPVGIPGGTVASDTAAVSGDFGGVSQTVNISSTLTTGLTALTLGDTNATPGATTIGSTGGSLVLNGATLNSNGTAGAVNTISAPITLTGNLIVGNAVANTNNLTISGKITPSAAASRAIENSGMKTVTLGDVDISTGATTGVVLTIRSGTTSASTAGSHLVLNGTIADGGSAAGALILGARSGNLSIGTSSIQINGTNTYTGATTLGIQANVVTVYKINSDQPFGPSGSSLTIGAGSLQNFLEAVGTDRTIAKNSTTINRSIGFQGSNSLTLAATTLNISNSPGTGTSFFTNNITASGKTVTLGLPSSNMYLNGSNTTDLYRMRDVAGAGTTIIASNIADNSGATVPADSRMVVQQAGSGTLILAGNNTYQGGTRITGTGTVQLGNGGTTGSLAPANGSVPIVNSTAAGTLAFNRSDAVSTGLTANGPVGLLQKGSGSLTLTNSQFNSGTNTVGDGTTASKLVVTGSLVPSRSTTSNATVGTVAPGTNLTVNTVALSGSDTVAGLNLKVGQPVYLTSGGASSVAYIDSLTGATTFRVSGLGSTGNSAPLTAGTVALTFGEGSALGTSAAITTVNNLSTLAGTGVISGAVSGLAGSHLAPGVNTTDADASGRFNFGVAGTLTTGALTLTGASLDFDLAATAAGTSDLISTGSSAVSFSSLSFSFNALTAGVLEVGTPYNLVTGAGSFTGDASLISTTFGTDLLGLYTPTYSVAPSGLQVVFATAIPEPASIGLVLGLATLGGCLVRRRRKAQA